MGNRRGMAYKPPTNLAIRATASGEEPSQEDLRRLNREFFSIGFPAFIQLAAEPLAALVDTAYLGMFITFEVMSY